MLKFSIKVLRTSLFLNPVIDLVNVCDDDRYWSKIYCSTIPTYIHDLKVKVTDLENFYLKFYVKVFRTSLFLNPEMDLVHVWYNDRYWSKILCVTIPTPLHDLKIKVMGWSFPLKFLGPHYLEFFVTVLCLSFLQCQILHSLWYIWFMFGMVIDTGPKMFLVPSTSQFMTFKVKVTEIISMLKFYVKIFTV